MEELTIGEMISMLDGAAGRLIVVSMHDGVVNEAKEMITKVSVALGELAEQMDEWSE